MKVPCIAVSYGKSRCFVSALPGSYLADTKKVLTDFFSPENKDGYQRPANRSRYREIARFLTQEDAFSQFLGPVMGQSIVLNCRQLLTFEPSGADASVGTLGIPDSAMLYIVDGQHRVGGIREALTKSADLSARLIPVIITAGMDNIREMVHFYLINTSQVKVSTDIAQRILARQEGISALWQEIQTQGKAWIKRAIEIVDLVNEKEGQPWYHRIKIPQSSYSGTMASQNAFATSLRILLTHSSYKERPADYLAELVCRYWQGIQLVVPDAFARPKDFLLQKTLGLYAMHTVMPQVFDRAIQQARKVTAESVAAVLKSPLAEGANYWHAKTGELAKYGTGNKATRLLTRQLENKLPTSEFEEIL